MKIPVNLENYPHLLQLVQQEPEQLKVLLQSFFSFVDKSVEKEYLNKSKEHFNIEFVSLLEEITSAFFDYEGIAENHANSKEAELLKMLGHENNPLAVFTSGAEVWDFNGNTLTKEQFYGKSTRDFNVKDWLQGLLYASRYLPYESYVRYMSLGKFDLVEGLKYANVEQLIKVQPALNYQREHNLPIGQFIPGTAFFDCGEWNEEAQQLITNELETDTHVFCLDSKAGFYK